MSALRPVFNTLRRQVRKYQTKPSQLDAPPHMNEMPVPNGSWQEAYNAKQRKYNTILAAGLSFGVFSLFVGKETGLLYFNFYAPESID